MDWIEQATDSIGYIIKRHINKLDLGEDYVVAGGFVANSIYSIVYPDLDVPLNDIDVYSLTPARSSSWGVHGKADGVHTLTQKRESRYAHGYPGLFVQNEVTYVINSVESLNNKVEHIELSPTCHTTKMEADVLLQRVIDSFDLNCCQAGYIPKTNKLILSKNFIDFLNTKQVEIVNIHSIKTLLRALKKAKDLNAYVNEDYLYDLIVSLYGNDPHLIEDFTVKKFQDQIHYLQEKGVAKIELKKGWFIHMKGEKNPIYAQISSGMGDDIVPIFKQIYYNTNHYRKNLEYLSKYQNLKPFILGNLNYIDQNPTLSKASTLNEFFEEHREFISKLGRLTFNQQLQFRQDLLELAKEEGLHIIGLAESLEDLVIDGRLNLTELKKNIEDNRKEMESMLNTPLPEILFIDFFVKELLCKRDLLDEGVEMKHCVGGYASSVESGYCRIFSIIDKKNPKNRSTLDIRPNEENDLVKFSIFQHRSHTNNDPNPRNVSVGKELVEKLNKQNLNYEIYFPIKTNIIPF